MNYVEHHEWISKRAEQIAARYYIDPDDAKQDAYFGFIAAERLFNPDKGVLFKTFASQKVFGAILDKHRDRSWFFRSNTDFSPSSVDESPEMLDCHTHSDPCDIDFERAIAPIKGEARLYLEMRIIADMNNTEIGKACGVPWHRVNDVFQKTKKTLRAGVDALESC